ncbi:hypothetical protein J3R82DRAFT_10621 [Butyriboletus roseoflavus]|nr:hypothetical protein J3R82DRAFT_10621 [Butyriboletus roseoflavus]
MSADTIGSQMQTDIFTTLLVFLSSLNREIVKSTLGAAKLAIHTLPADLLRPHLSSLVPTPGVVTRSQESFQGKSEEQAFKVATGVAFEDVLYGSESELDESDDEEQVRREGSSKRKGSDHGLSLRVDDDESMRLLQGAASRMTNAKTDRRRKPGQDANRFKTDEESGKLVVPAEESDSDIKVSARKAAKDVVGNAYKESVTSADGFVRGPNGRIKFNKDTKKRSNVPLCSSRSSNSLPTLSSCSSATPVYQQWPSWEGSTRLIEQTHRCIPSYSSPSSRDLRSEGSSWHVPFIPGGGITHRLLSSIPDSWQIPTVCLLQYAMEGDNRLDAQLLATVAAKALGSTTVISTWTQPKAWAHGLFGTPHDQTLYG